MSDWISVKDRLPDHGQDVICYGKPWGVRFSAAYIDFDGVMKFANYRLGCGDNPDVTHWMPLPDPPEA